MMHFDDNQVQQGDLIDVSITKADLYKLGKYSIELLKMIRDDHTLSDEAQAKITKASDYIASIYHLVKHNLKQTQFSNHLENEGMYEEKLKAKFQQKLNEARIGKGRENATIISSSKNKKPKSGGCAEDCGSCQETCDSRKEPINEMSYDEFSHPKIGKAILANHGGMYMIGIDKEGEPFKILALNSDYRKVNQRWQKLKQDLAQYPQVESMIQLEAAIADKLKKPVKNQAPKKPVKNPVKKPVKKGF